MAYAKLSGALLACNDAEPAPAMVRPVPPPKLAPPAAAGGSEQLADHLRALRLSVFLTEYDRLAQQCAVDGLDHSGYLLRLAELEVKERRRRRIERRIKEARFPAVKSLDSFDFAASPSLDKSLVLALARCEYLARRENILVVGNSGTGKTHLALGLGLAACREGLSVGFTTAASLVHKLLETRGERLVNLRRRLVAHKLLIIDDLGYVPLAATGTELLLELLSQRCERGSTMISTNLPTDRRASVFGTAQLTGAVLDRLTSRVHRLETAGPSYCASPGHRNVIEPEALAG
jgi:DNA replication protein DnaC